MRSRSGRDVGGVVGQKLAPVGALFDMSNLRPVKTGGVLSPPSGMSKSVEA